MKPTNIDTELEYWQRQDRIDSALMWVAVVLLSTGSVLALVML